MIIQKSAIRDNYVMDTIEGGYVPCEVRPIVKKKRDTIQNNDIVSTSKTPNKRNMILYKSEERRYIKKCNRTTLTD